MRPQQRSAPTLCTPRPNRSVRVSRTVTAPHATQHPHGDGGGGERRSDGSSPPPPRPPPRPCTRRHPSPPRPNRPPPPLGARGPHAAGDHTGRPRRRRRPAHAPVTPVGRGPRTPGAAGAGRHRCPTLWPRRADAAATAPRGRVAAAACVRRAAACAGGGGRVQEGAAWGTGVARGAAPSATNRGARKRAATQRSSDGKGTNAVWACRFEPTSKGVCRPPTVWGGAVERTPTAGAAAGAPSPPVARVTKQNRCPRPRQGPSTSGPPLGRQRERRERHSTGKGVPRRLDGQHTLQPLGAAAAAVLCHSGGVTDGSPPAVAACTRSLAAPGGGGPLTGRSRRVLPFVAQTTTDGIAYHRVLRVNGSAPDLPPHDAERLQLTVGCAAVLLTEKAATRPEAAATDAAAKAATTDVAAKV